MAYKCQKDWFELTFTNKPGIKHCNTCNQEVFFCLEEAELNERIIEGVCVAYFIEPDRSIRFKLAREKTNFNIRDPKFKPHMMLGLPSGHKVPKIFNKD